MRNELSTLAIIIPCYNEEEGLEKSHQVFLSILDEMKSMSLISDNSYICYVNDGSIDKTWKIIKSFIDGNRNVQGISFSRNFGHQSAMLAGLTTCVADVFITIDADLQEDPNAMKEMIKKYNEGYEIVYGVRSERKDNFFKKTFADIFYKMMKKLGSDSIPNASEYRLISKRVVEEIKKYNEKNIYLRGIIASIGLSYAVVYYKRGARIAGETKYTTSKLIRTALNGVITSSHNLFHFVLYCSLFMSFITFTLFILLILSFFLNFYISELLFGFLISFISTVQFFILYMMSEYLNRIYIEARGRPLYIISEDCTK